LEADGKGCCSLSTKKQPKRSAHPAETSGARILESVLTQTDIDLDTASNKKAREGKPLKRELAYSIVFARHMSAAIAEALRADFPSIQSGENPSRALSGTKRLDVNYSTPEAGLGFAISLKSVHQGEKDGGKTKFTHNMKRNDEELRGEATNHHLRQPYAVLVAALFLPFESCADAPKASSASSFGKWVQYLWRLKGREKPDDAPDLFELVFIALYARNGTELAFYQVGGETKCPRVGRPKNLLSFAEFVELIKKTYHRRNGNTFFFEGEEPE